MNAAFQGSIKTPNANSSLPCEPTISEAELKLLDVLSKSDEEPDVTDIKGMSADDIQRLLQQLSQADGLSTPILHPKEPKTPAIPTAPITCTNRFQGLTVEEISEDNLNSPLLGVTKSNAIFCHVLSQRSNYLYFTTTNTYSCLNTCPLDLTMTLLERTDSSEQFRMA